MKAHMDIMTDGHPMNARWVTGVNPGFWEVSLDPGVDLRGCTLLGGARCTKSWLAWMRRLMRRRFHPPQELVPLQEQLRLRKRRRSHK